MVELNVLVAAVGVLASGLSAYVGVKVALAEIRGDVARHDRDLRKHDERIDRLEAPYFDKEAR